MAKCSTVEVNNIITTEYHQQFTGQAEQFNRTLILRFCHYVSEGQTDWHTFLLASIHFYDMHEHRSIKVSLFSLVLTRTPPEPDTIALRRPCVATGDAMASPM